MKYIINGLLKRYDNNRSRNTIYYTQEEFQKQLDILFMKERFRKINKIIKNDIK